jgi:hypothetical protein
MTSARFLFLCALLSFSHGLLQQKPLFAKSLSRSGDRVVLGRKTASSATAASAPVDTEEWTKKRLHNTAAFRSLAILGAVAVAGTKSSAQFLPAQATASIHVLSFATWFGTVAYTTFVLGITMFKNLPRQTFGKLQAKLFPTYFALSSVALVLQLATAKAMPVFASKSMTALGVALAMTALNQFYLEPVSTINMMERYSLESRGEKESNEYKRLKSQFGKFHGMSSLTNLVALCGGVAHAIYMAAALI